MVNSLFLDYTLLFGFYLRLVCLWVFHYFLFHSLRWKLNEQFQGELLGLRIWRLRRFYSFKICLYWTLFSNVDYEGINVFFCVWADEFRDFFSQFGEARDHIIITNHATSILRGFGFITFTKEQAVDDLLAKENKVEMVGSQVSRLPKSLIIIHLRGLRLT